MATNPKVKPCPLCDRADGLDIYTYDNGWRHVECDFDCGYLGPGEGSIRQAIKSHNTKRDETCAAHLAALANRPVCEEA